MFRTRLLSGIVLVLLAIGVITCGGIVLAGTLLLVSVIGMRELYRVFQVADAPFSPLEISGYLGIAVYYVLLFQKLESYTVMVFLTVLITMMAVYVFTYPRYKASQITGAYFAVLYVGVMLSGIYQIRTMEYGMYLVWLVFLASWGCDTCAYCVGKLIGKHKMSPNLSPKKSIEGAVGGVTGSIVLGILYACWVRGRVNAQPKMILVFAVVCAAGALISMVGDLAASAIKRNYDIKDYGTLIPGHGGIMDRFDSVILITPVIYYLVRFLI